MYQKNQNRINYARLVSRNLDLSQNYIFCALQYQPEKSTCPLGGLLNEQYLMVEMLSKFVPKNWKIYVKEHPSQFVYNYTRYGEISRNKKYYEKLNRIRNVELVPLELNTISIIRSSKAVASVAGTLLITEAVVSKGKEKENQQPGGVDPSMLLG